MGLIRFAIRMPRRASFPTLRLWAMYVQVKAMGGTHRCRWTRAFRETQAGAGAGAGDDDGDDDDDDDDDVTCVLHT
jgi:hypothetical protein